MILENVRCGRKRHLWLSVAWDLHVDARRDLDDVHGSNIPLHALNKLPAKDYSKKLASGKVSPEGVWAW